MIRRLALALLASAAGSAALAQAPVPAAPIGADADLAPASANAVTPTPAQSGGAPAAASAAPTIQPAARAPAAAPRPAAPPAPYRPEVIAGPTAGPVARQGAAPAPMAPQPAGAGVSSANIAAAIALRDQALNDPTAWALLEELTTEIGGRPVGSPAMTRAKDWAIAKMNALGFENVRAEPFVKQTWTRGSESLMITVPYRKPLSVLALGNSAAGNVQANIVVFKSLAELRAAPAAAITGKIVVVNQPMTRTQDGSGYGAAVAVRSQGPSIASQKGAVGFLTRSVSTGDSRLPHTGNMSYAPGVKPIPAGALGVPDADLLERLAARGRPVEVSLDLQSTVNAKGTAWNIVGDLRGSERPNEIIVIGGHLDSWDPGEGAIDDGAGVAITAAVGKLIAGLPTRPKRTIRVVMFGSEETGGSSEAYMVAHAAEVPRTVFTGESDLGGDSIYQLRLPAGFAADPRIAPLHAILAPLRIFVSPEPVVDAGADVAGLVRAGVPAFQLSQDASRYFDLHHSADDTLDKVDPAKLAQNVAAWVALIHFVADSDIDFRQPALK
jgi:Zn-dependent M28 family amino/carboxypeptidase